MSRYCNTLTGLLVILSTGVFAQAADSTNYLKSIQNTVAFFHQSQGLQSPLNYGVIHEGYAAYIKGSAYFRDADWSKGNLLYNGILYQDILLRFDEVSQKLIAQNYKGGAGVTLRSEWLQRFTLLGHTFLKIERDRPDDIIQSGFYDQVYKGKASFYVYRKKIYYEELIQEVVREFLVQHKYYIRKDATWHEVDSKKAVLKVLSDRQKELQKYIRKNKINFRQDREGAILNTVSYYENLP